MPKAEAALQKHTMNFFEGDVDKLRRYYPDVEVSTLIRELIHDFIARTEATLPEAEKPQGIKLELPGVQP